MPDMRYLSAVNRSANSNRNFGSFAPCDCLRVARLLPIWVTVTPLGIGYLGGASDLFAARLEGDRGVGSLRKEEVGVHVSLPLD